MRLLLIENDAETAQPLCQELSCYGYVVDQVGGGVDVLRLATSEEVDLVLFALDARVPEKLDVVRHLRRHGWSIPLIVLLADDQPALRVRALEAGADDVAGNPPVYAELDARIKVLIRRARHDGLSHIHCGLLTYHTSDRLFSAAGTPLTLTPREHAVLEALVTQSGHVVRKQTIYHKVYNLDSVASPEAIEIYVHRLRRRLEGCGVSIVTVRGYGYRIEANPGVNVRRRQAGVR